MNRFFSLGTISLFFCFNSFSATFFEKAQTSFYHAFQIGLSDISEVLEYKHTDCVAQKYPNRVEQNSFKIVKLEDAVLGSIARLTVDNLSYTLTEMESGDLGNEDVSSKGTILKKTTIRILKNTNKSNFILESVEIDGGIAITSYCWW